MFAASHGCGDSAARVVMFAVARSSATDEPCRRSGHHALLGRANWWAPRPLRRLYARYGIREEIHAERAEVPV